MMVKNAQPTIHNPAYSGPTAPGYIWQPNARGIHKQGVTQVELLIVITIMAILVALAIPAFRKIKAKGNSAICVSNLRQTGLLIQNFVVDQGYYPPTVSQSTSEDGSISNLDNAWQIMLQNSPCVECPSAKFAGDHPTLAGQKVSGFSANPMVLRNVADAKPPYVRPAQISRPSEIVLLTDGAQFNDKNNPRSLGLCFAWWKPIEGDKAKAMEPLTADFVPTGGFWDPEISLIPLRHEGRANILFVDGHVSSIGSIGELKQRNVYINY